MSKEIANNPTFIPDSFSVFVPPGFLSPIVRISCFENIKPIIRDHGIAAEKKLTKNHNDKLIKKPLMINLK